MRSLASAVSRCACGDMVAGLLALSLAACSFGTKAPAKAWKPSAGSPQCDTWGRIAIDVGGVGLATGLAIAVALEPTIEESGGTLEPGAAPPIRERDRNVSVAMYSIAAAIGITAIAIGSSRARRCQKARNQWHRATRFLFLGASGAYRSWFSSLSPGMQQQELCELFRRTYPTCDSQLEALGRWPYTPQERALAIALLDKQCLARLDRGQAPP